MRRSSTPPPAGAGKSGTRDLPGDTRATSAVGGRSGSTSARRKPSVRIEVDRSSLAKGVCCERFFASRASG